MCFIPNFYTLFDTPPTRHTPHPQRPHSTPSLLYCYLVEKNIPPPKYHENAIGDCVFAKTFQYDYHTGDENDDRVDD